LQVTGLAAGEEVSIAGLTLRSGVLGGKAATALVVGQCTGTVVLADLFAGGSAVTATPALVRVTGSQQVNFDACNFGLLVSGTQAPTEGMIVEDSNVDLNACVLKGAAAPALFSPSPLFDGASALAAMGSVVRISLSLSLSDLTGGAGMGSSPFFSPGAITSGGAAVDATTSIVFARGGAGNQLKGGLGGFAVVGGLPTYGPGGPAVALGPDSLLSTTGD